MTEEEEALTGLELGIFYVSFPNCCFRGGGSQVMVQTRI